MTPSGSDIVVIAARRPVAVALQAVLHDWMVQALVNPCRIVDLDSVDPGNPAIPAIVLSADDAQPVSLQQDLAHSRVTGVRLAVVGVIDEDATAVTAQQAGAVLEAIRQTVPSVPCVQLSVSAGSPGAEWAGRALALFGWHNLAVSPEESAAPSQGAAALAASTEDPRWLLLLTGTLCSLTGLWPGQAQAPFDQRQAPSGGLIVPVRAFSRSVSSGSVQDALAARLVSVRDRYPTPRVDALYAVSIDNESAAAIGMAEQLLAKHADVLARPRQPSAVPPPVKIGAWDAVKQFLGFAGAALLNAPRAAAAAVNRTLSQAAASAVQNAIFGGADSGYAVVVRGVRADGSSASWTDYEDSLDSVTRRAFGEGELAPVPQKPALWRDFVDAGMTLLDAGNRSTELTPRTHGSQRAVITTTDVVGPDPTDTFTLPASLAAFLPNWNIEAGDDIAVGRLFERLDYLGQTQPHLAQVVSAERNRLREWANAARDSYAGHVGRRLGDAHRGLIQEVQDLTAAIDRLSGQQVRVEEDSAEEDELASRVRVMTGVSVSLVAILISLASLGVFGWLWAVLGILLIVLGWASGGAYVHMKSSARLHALIHRQRAAATELDDAIRHRREALEDLRRVSRAYRQFLDWSRVLGAFIHAPLGNPSATAERELHVGRGLPLNLAIGVATADQESIDDVANRWRGELFRVGWLSDAWREFTADLPASLGPLRHHLQNDPNLLANDPSYERVPVLTRWSTELSAQASKRGMSPGVGARIVDLTRADAKARDRLLSRVLVRDPQGQRRHMSRTEFIEGLEASDALGSLQPGMFNPAASVVDIRAVKQTFSQEDATGLDVALVVVQVGGAYEPGQFAGQRREDAGPTPLQQTEGFI